MEHEEGRSFKFHHPQLIEASANSKNKVIRQHGPSIPFLPLKQEGDKQVVDVESIAKDMKKMIISEKGSKFGRKLLKQATMSSAFDSPRKDGGLR